MDCDIPMEFLEFDKYLPYICCQSSDFRKIPYLTEPNVICDVTHRRILFVADLQSFSFNYSGGSKRLWIKRKCICILNIIYLFLILKLKRCVTCPLASTDFGILYYQESCFTGCAAFHQANVCILTYFCASTLAVSPLAVERTPKDRFSVKIFSCVSCEYQMSHCVPLGVLHHLQHTWLGRKATLQKCLKIPATIFPVYISASV